jgi:hypothetical protein
MGNLTDPNLSKEELEKKRAENNPEGRPVGHFTGRCGKCGSTDLWDDATAYGCNCCNAIFMTGDLFVIAVPNTDPFESD